MKQAETTTVRSGSITLRLVLLVWALACAPVQAHAGPTWAVCYSDRPSPRELLAYDLVVLDPDRHPPLGPVLDRGRTVLAYLSLTQIGTHRAVFDRLSRQGVVLEAHPVWRDAHYLDFRRPEWQRLVVGEIVPRMLDAGFSGLFLDTLDDAAYLEAQDPERFRGMRRSAVELVRAIRHHYPQLVLMMNRGYALLPEVASSIDVLLGESVLATFDPATRQPRRVSSEDAAWQVDALRGARALNPRLRLFTLDYWDPADVEGVRALYRQQRANGFVPYVATPALDHIVEEPQ
jgi:uncharacterized protein (TIGR01370 family)